MVVFTLTSCPPKVCGDLSKWLWEIDTGVYAGPLSARVRDMLWERICENLQDGRATMVYCVQSRMQFRVHNSLWKPVDYDGLTLLKRPLDAQSKQSAWYLFGDGKKPLSADCPSVGEPGAVSLAEHDGYANKPAVKEEKVSFETGAQVLTTVEPVKSDVSATHSPVSPIQEEVPWFRLDEWVTVDLETTGLYSDKNEITEVGAIRWRGTTEGDRFQSLIIPKKMPTVKIQKINGITVDMLLKDGRKESEVMQELITFVGTTPIVCHHAPFEKSFLAASCLRCGYPLLANIFVDTNILARELMPNMDCYRLAALAKHYGFDNSKCHRSLADCMLVQQLFVKLKEICYNHERKR